NISNAHTEADVILASQSLLKKDYPQGYKYACNRPFTGFPPDLGFNDGLSAPQPDYVQGLAQSAFGPFPADEQLNGAILYKNDYDPITLPHLAGEWKGPLRLTGAKVQSAYDGACLVYSRNQALSYLGTPDPPGHAQVTTFTLDGTLLNQFAHYARPSSTDGRPEYHQYPINSTLLTNSYQEFKTGRKELRNAQDYAMGQSHQLRDQLRDHWREQQR
ncbi:hypothetical protein M406DRAFT_232605, partial [Cryphonectria parasitica EP155]